MGKAQSKRSVDITTEGKKGPEEEVTGKLEKIEDIDQKQLNGDATPQERNDAEKKDGDESENEKDMTTEKSAEAVQGGGDNAEQNAGNPNNSAVESPKEETAASAEEISPLAATDESAKKSKKEKLKKKWSFRSISFGKKDKQKPAKTEETAEIVPATNGDAEKSEKATKEDATETIPKEKETGDTAAKTGEKLENGNASEQELNGPKTPTPTEGTAKAAVVAANETTVTVMTNATSAGSDSAPAAAVDATTTNNDTATAIKNETEKKNTTAVAAAAATESIATAVVSNGAAADIEKNGIESPVTEHVKDVKELATNKAAEICAVVENNKTIPNVINDGETPHQNGTNAGDKPEATDAEQLKTQIEVNTHIHPNTDINSTANVASSHSTSNSCDPLLPTTIQSNNSNDLNNLKKEEVETVVEMVASQVSECETIVDADCKHLDECGDAIAPHCDTIPPPLPVSPPPSQVSVFAFNDNTETCDNIAKIAEEVANTLMPPSSPQPIELIAETDAVSIENPNIVFMKSASNAENLPNAQTPIETNIIKGELDNVETLYNTISNSVTEMQQVLQEQVLNVLTMCDTEPEVIENEPLTKSADNAKSTLDIDTNELAAANVSASDIEQQAEIEPAIVAEHQNENSEHNAEIIAATIVVDEIAEKAAQIIQQKEEEKMQKEQHDKHEHVIDVVAAELNAENLEQAVDGGFEVVECEAAKTLAAIDIVVDDDVMTGKEQNTNENANVDEIIDIIGITPMSFIELVKSKETPATADELAQEYITEYTDEHKVPQTDNQINQYEEDCALVLQQIDKMSLNDDCHELSSLADIAINPTKEIATAKELKENVAAEITTQELPVTCE